ncbi:MAG: redoxin domain-containing protein [Woeseia sp.]
MSTGILIAILALLALASGAWWFVNVNVRGRPLQIKLQVGERLPDFAAEDEAGNAVNSAQLHGKPAVLLFIRGNWCPFCNRQVEDLTRYYKEINELGARLIFFTPKPLGTTRRVAQMFGVDFEFWLDAELAAAHELGLVHQGGVPGKQQPNYGQDTIWPTALVCDADGVVRHISQSKRIVDRPDPAQLLSALRSLA